MSKSTALRLAEIFPETTPGYWINLNLIELKRIAEQWEPRPETR
jgi:hypothetical protein